MAALIEDYNWSGTSLGALAEWPACLRTSVALVLRSKVPMVLLWGVDGVMIYNDAYAIFAGKRHPQLLGSKVREGWAEVAEFNDNVMRVCLAGGTLAYRDQELTLNRSGVAEQVWMNLDYSSIPDNDGQPAGVIAIVVETTDKVVAERWRSGEQERLRQLFEQSPGFVAMMFGPQHIFEVTNDAFSQLIGRRDVLGKTVRDALPEITGQGFFELLDNVYATGERYVGSADPALLQRSAGALEERFVDFIFHPMRDASGAVIGVIVQGNDVTDRVVAERDLRRSEAQFRTFAEAMPNQVWSAKPDGQIDWLNTRVYEYARQSEKVLLGSGWTLLVHPDDIARASALWKKALETGLPYEVEFRLLRHDGTFRWHLARAVPIRDAGGEILQWIGANTDIDEQKRITQALFESEHRLQLSQNAAGIASLELDVASGMVKGGERFWGLWGLSDRDSVHISVLENIVIPDDRRIRSTEATRQAGTAVPSVEYRIKRPDTGEKRWLARHIEFVRDVTGKPVKMFGVMQDVTDRKEAEVRQELLVHELEHRIKNILAMVSAIASQTLRNTDLESARAVFADRLKALATAHDILNQTRWTNASLHEVIESTIAAFPGDRISIEGPQLAINPKMALSMALAVNELATNASKYGALARPEGRVRIRWTLGPGQSEETAGLTWTWSETGGPPVSPPGRRGFGTLLLERVLATDFGGTVQLSYAFGGFECTLTSTTIPHSVHAVASGRTAH